MFFQPGLETCRSGQCEGCLPQMKERNGARRQPEATMPQLEDVVALIHTLYAPNQTGSVILHAQQQLQTMQKREDADRLAHELLQSSDQNVQFFGALTYTVYITTHNVGPPLAELMADEIVDAYRRNLSPLAITKLISNLGKIYARTLYSPLDALFDKLALLALDQTTLLQLGLLSCKIIAEELNRSEDLTKEQNREIIDSMLDGTTRRALDASIPLISQNGNDSVKQLWFECLQAWMVYASRVEFDFAVTIDLNDYFSIALDLLATYSDIDALNLFSDIYDTNSALLSHDNKKKLDALIFSEWSTKFIASKDADDLSKLSRFITLFLDSDMISLATKMLDSNCDYKFQYLLYLTNQPGSPIVEESFSVDLLDFWILFTESFINDTDSIHAILENDEKKISALNKKAHDYFLSLSQIYWNKCHLIDDLDEVEDEFYNFRRDIAELFESLFSIARDSIFNDLTHSIISTLNNRSAVINNEQVKDIEASFYLLTAISSMFGERSITAQFLTGLNALFQCNFLESILQLNNIPSVSGKIYRYLVRITIKFLSEINWFYESETGEPYINGVLIFLFQNLNSKSYQESSSKAILLITDSCRDKLSGLLNDFEAAANSMIVNKFEVDINVRAGIIRSYANILQTIQDLSLQAHKISNFLDVIYYESINAYQSIESNISNPEALENIKDFLVSMISSLVGLAKGLQIPEDWEDYYEGNETMIQNVYTYWKFEDSKHYQVHEKCLKLVSLFSFPNEILTESANLRSLDPQMLDQVFLFFKSGLSEPFPGPFVIDYNIIIQYITKCCRYCQTATLSNSAEPPMIKIIELYGLLVGSNHTLMTISKITNLELGITDLQMDLVINEILFKQFDKIINEPDIMQAVFNLFGGILAKYPSNLLSNEQIMKIIAIGIEQLYENAQQRFVVMALSKMWSNLIYLRKGKIGDIEIVHRILIEENVGNVLVYAMMKGFIVTSRSNVEFYSDIIRALTAKYGKYLGGWITNSFAKINSESAKEIVKEEEVKTFIKKLILTRGNRAANRVVQEFWLSVTGMVDYGM